MRIDFHTHAFPDAIAPGALHRLVENAKPFQHLYGPVQAHTNLTLSGLSASSRQAGLDISVVLPIATSPKPSHTINDFAAMADKLPGLRSFGSVHPRNPEWRQELERVRELGLRGIKLHPEYQDCFADDTEVIAVVRAAAELQLWVVFHAGADIGMAPPIHCTPDRVRRLRAAVADGKIILAHMGGYRLWDEVLRALPEMNVWLDTSYCLPNHPEQQALFAEMIRANGCDRVLYGSDSPWLDQTESLTAAEKLFQTYGFTPAEQAAILGGNAARILGLTEIIPQAALTDE